MPRKAKGLTEAKIRAAKADAYPLWDSLGLHLIRGATGERHWRLKYYRPDGRENRIALGSYPARSLSDAQAERDRIRLKLRDGIDPAEQRATEKAAKQLALRSTFALSAEAWLAHKSKAWAATTAKKARWLCDTHLIPALGKKSVASLSRADVLPVLSKLASDSPDVAVKAVQYVAGIVRKARQDGVRDESRGLLLDGILEGKVSGHIPAATEPDDIAALMRAIDGYASPVTRAALLWCAYTAQRPGNVVAARWSDLRGDEWHIPPEQMKVRQKQAHIVPLPRQAHGLLETLRPFTGGREYVFPPQARQNTPHLHRDALSKALRDMGFTGKHSTHGFRGMLRTAGRERLGIESEVLDAQLAHAKRGKVQQAYDRTTFNEARVKAMQRWADWLDTLAKGSNVTPLQRKARA